MLLENLNHDMQKSWNDMLKDVDRESNMEDKDGGYDFMQSEWDWKMEMKARSTSTHTLKGSERMEEMWMKEYVKGYGEWIEEVAV